MLLINNRIRLPQKDLLHSNKYFFYDFDRYCLIKQAQDGDENTSLQTRTIS